MFNGNIIFSEKKLITLSEEYVQKSSGNYFPNDEDRSGYPDGIITDKDLKVKRYVALLIQSGTGAPVATVLENTLGIITWSRVNDGIGKAIIDGGFDNTKTIILLCKIGAPQPFTPNSVIRCLISSEQLFIYSSDGGGNPIDNWGTYIEIKVYS